MEPGASFSLKAWQCWDKGLQLREGFSTVPIMAQLTLKGQRQVWGCDGAKVGFCFIPHVFYLSVGHLCSTPLATKPCQALDHHEQQSAWLIDGGA